MNSRLSVLDELKLDSMSDDEKYLIKMKIEELELDEVKNSEDELDEAYTRGKAAGRAAITSEMRQHVKRLERLRDQVQDEINEIERVLEGDDES
jgi:hypothetical protein